MVNKVKKKLARWKGRFLPFVGQTCLIKYVLTIIPLFDYSFFKMSSKVCNPIIRLQIDFLWSWEEIGRKIT